MRRLLMVAFLFLSSGLPVMAQDSFESTWRFPASKGLGQALKDGVSANPSARPEAANFTPGADSGAALALTRALAKRPQDQEELSRTLGELRGVYDKSVLEEGRTNNLAAAFAFFIASNLTVFTAKEPTEAANDRLFHTLEAAIAATPEVANLSDGEKQEMHDWLVSMAGISLATYVSADFSGHPEAVANAQELAASSLRLVLGVEPSAISLDENGLTIIPDF